MSMHMYVYTHAHVHAAGAEPPTGFGGRRVSSKLPKIGSGLQMPLLHAVRTKWCVQKSSGTRGCISPRRVSMLTSTHMSTRTSEAAVPPRPSPMSARPRPARSAPPQSEAHGKASSGRSLAFWLDSDGGMRADAHVCACVLKCPI